jgi:CzcA family heavy metal efflux pump
MLNKIIALSLRLRGIVIALAVVLLVYGVYSIRRAKYDVFPEFAPPQATVRAEAPGLSPEQVELLITTPLENAIIGIEGIESLRSTSIQGLSNINAAFRPTSNIYLARQLISERLVSGTARLPSGVTPALTPLTSSTGTVLVLGITSDSHSVMDLKTIAEWTVKRRLLAVPGVAKVAVFGGGDKQLQIQVQPARLYQFGLSIEDILRTARKATGVKGSGFVDTENQRIVLRTEGQSIAPDQLARVVLVHQPGANVTLGDVAKVAYAPEPAIGAGAIMGEPGIVLSVSSQYGANTLEVTHKLDLAIRELLPTLRAEGVTLYPDLFRPAKFIRIALRNVLGALEIGAILVVVVLFLFLFNLRTAAISFTAIPLSLLAAVIILEQLGLSLNTMVLSGLAIAIGEVVDDAVIYVENIFRRLRENNRATDPRPTAQILLDASVEVRGAVIYATFCVILVFFPLLTLSGVAGRLFSPLGIAYIMAVVASLLVALTVTPALCFLLLRDKAVPKKEPPLYRWMKVRYGSLLLRIDRHPRWVSMGVVVLIAGGAAALPFMEAEFLPSIREGHFIVHMTAVPGTSIEESLRMGHQVTMGLLKLPYVRSVAQRAGRAELGEETRGTNSSEMDVELKTIDVGQRKAESEIRKTVSELPGANFEVNTFLAERMEETISGHIAPVIIKVFGNDLDVLDDKARQIFGIVSKIRGATDVMIPAVAETPQVVIKLRKEDLTHWGFDPVSVLDAIGSAYQGNIVGHAYKRDQVFDVSVILSPQDRSSVSSIAGLPLRNSSGTYVRLRQIADVYETSGRYEVLHEGARRVQTVTCNVGDRNVSDLVKDARRQVLSSVSFPKGTYIEFSGAAEAEARSKRDLLLHSLLSGIGIILLLFVVLRRYPNVLLVLLNLPFALVGGVLAALISGGVLSLGSIVGFVTVFGITLRNSIMMISHFEHLVSVEGMTWGPAAALQGASERLAPILMTALVTAFGLLPLALGSGAPGREIEGPLAVVILGGLLTSTMLNLLVLPALALRYGRFKPEDSGVSTLTG